MPKLVGIRGATTVERNDAEEILGATDELLRALIAANDLAPDDIVSALFTVTDDLDAAFPARAAEDFGWNIVALLHGREIPVPGSLPMCIRVLVHAYSTRPRTDVRHCYLRRAVVLRPDRAGGPHGPHGPRAQADGAGN
jgi:chorismate mutase